MISQCKLSELLKSYDINPKKILSYKWDKIISHGEYHKIKSVLDYLVDELGIKPSRIEKSPSVLYYGFDHIRENYRFLEEHGFRTLKLNHCVHILACNPEKLSEIYQYIYENYGSNLLHSISSILSAPVSLVKQVESISDGRLTKRGVLSSIVNHILNRGNFENDFTNDVKEIGKIIETCEELGINYQDGGVVFCRTANEIRELVSVCREYGINYKDSGFLFRRNVSEIKDIVRVCEDFGIDYKNSSSIYHCKPAEILAIAEVCKKYGIRYQDGGVVFSQTAFEIENIVRVCEENDIRYKTGGVVFERNAEEIKDIILVCTKYGIDYRNGGSIFKKTANEIEDIVKVCIKYDIDYKRRGAIFLSTASKIKEVVKVAKKYDIKYKNGGNVFLRSADEIEEIVEVCKKYDIKYQSGGSLFEATADKIETVVQICMDNGIKYKNGGLIFERDINNIKGTIEVCREFGIDYQNLGSVFKKKPDTLRKIAQICRDENVELAGSLFFVNPVKLQESINYVRDNYGERYVNRMIVCQNPDKLREILPYFDECGYLEGLLGRCAGVLTLSFDEIKEREEVIKRCGQEVIIDGSFNPIFGQTRKKYYDKHKDVVDAVRSEKTEAKVNKKV